MCSLEFSLDLPFLPNDCIIHIFNQYLSNYTWNKLIIQIYHYDTYDYTAFIFKYFYDVCLVRAFKKHPCAIMESYCDQLGIAFFE